MLENTSTIFTETIRKQLLRNFEAQIAASYVRAMCICLTVSNPVGVASIASTFTSVSFCRWLLSVRYL